MPEKAIAASIKTIIDPAPIIKTGFLVKYRDKALQYKEKSERRNKIV